jgi:IclR-like helix-turn-helix domain-containing protein
MAEELADTEGVPRDVIPNWLLGGERRRLLLETLTTRPKRGWTVPELVERTGCGQATAYEVIRVLRGLGLLESTDLGHRYRFASDHALVTPLRDLLKELRRYSSWRVDRPARGARRT